MEKTFAQEQLQNIKAVCVDMWEPYIAAVKEKSSQAQIVYDNFHIVKYLNKGIDETRKKVKNEPLLLNNSENLTDKERAKFMEINQANLLTARSCKMRENLIIQQRKRRRSQCLL